LSRPQVRVRLSAGEARPVVAHQRQVDRLFRICSRRRDRVLGDRPRREVKRPSWNPTLRKARAKLKNSGRADPSRSAPRRCLTPRGRRRDASGGWDRHRRGWRGT
jgi:hypothetical protein